MNQDSRHIVIAGAGHAGGSAAAMLRQLGWTGAITLIGEEPIAAVSAAAFVEGLADRRGNGREPGPAARQILS